MLGYILAAVLGFVLLLLGCSVLARSGPRTGRRPHDRPPVQPDQPSADAPTPDRSATASSAEADAARLTPHGCGRGGGRACVMPQPDRAGGPKST